MNRDQSKHNFRELFIRYRNREDLHVFIVTSERIVQVSRTLHYKNVLYVLLYDQ